MSLVVDQDLVIDAGCIGFVSPLATQTQIKHVLLTHCHMDHIASLPIFLDNVFVPGGECPTVYASPHAIQVLKSHIFNGHIWPDLLAIADGQNEFVRLVEVEPGTPFKIGELSVLPIQVDHAVPTLGYLVDDGVSAVAFVADTSPTEEIWAAANANTRLKAVFVESSFPSRMDWLADKTKHLTPALLRSEVGKLDSSARIIAVHLKAAFRDEVEQELKSLGIPHLEVGVPGTTYHF